MDDSGIRGPPFDLGNPQRVHERCATTPNGLKLGGSEFLMRVMGPVASRESAVLMEIWSMAFFYLRSMILCHPWLFQYVKYVKSHTLPGGMTMIMMITPKRSIVKSSHLMALQAEKTP